MGFLVGTLVLAMVGWGLLLNRWYQRDRIERLRDRARLRVIETQMAALRAALRIGMAEHLARRRMAELQRSDPFVHRMDVEDWRG